MLNVYNLHVLVEMRKVIHLKKLKYVNLDQVKNLLYMC